MSRGWAGSNSTLVLMAKRLQPLGFVRKMPVRRPYCVENRLGMLICNQHNSCVTPTVVLRLFSGGASGTKRRMSYGSPHSVP